MWRHPTLGAGAQQARLPLQGGSQGERMSHRLHSAPRHVGTKGRRQMYATTSSVSRTASAGGEADSTLSFRRVFVAVVPPRELVDEVQPRRVHEDLFSILCAKEEK